MRGNTLNLGNVRGTDQTLALSPEARSNHLYVVGVTGTGKSKLLEHLVRQDIMAWSDAKRCGLLLLDPHGSVYRNTVQWLAGWGRGALRRPIVLLDITRDHSIVAYNVLRSRTEATRSVVIDAMVEAIAHVWGAANTTATPLFARWASNLLTLLYVNKLTLAEIAPLLDDLTLRRILAEKLGDDELAKRDWELAGRLNPKDFEAQVSSTVNRLRTFIQNPRLRTMFGQAEESFDFRQAIDEGWIVLVNLSQEGGKVSKSDGDLFARLMLADLWTAMKERGKPQDASKIHPFYVYADEFQDLVTPTLAENLDQARGFGLHLTMSHQFPSQLSGQGPDGARLLKSVMANASNKIVFRTEADDLPPLAQSLFLGTMSPDKIKLKLYSTKVMGYREEERETLTKTHASTRGAGRSHGRGKTSGTSRPIDPPDAFDNEPGTKSENKSTDDSSNDFSTDGISGSVASSTVFIPEFGKELSNVQFENLVEQSFRAMQSLYSQDRRECTVRLLGMRAPVSLRTFDVTLRPVRPPRVEEFIDACAARWPFVLTATDASTRLQARQGRLVSRAKGNATGDEPKTAGRRRARPNEPPPPSFPG